MGAPVMEGQVVGGKYRVERVLGEGGMGVVVAATHLQLKERVALKFLLVEVAEGSERTARFLREAQAAVKIKSEHVARVSDVGTLDGGAPFLVMEYLEGEDLDALLQKRGPLPPAEAVEYVLQACDAIAEAHRAGIVHRDLKPANLFLTSRSDGSPCVKVLDFGISKVSGEGASLTKTSGYLGTPLYMSPEQLRSARSVDGRSDIWALGIILFELCTGLSPFDAQSVPELCSMILTATPARLRAIRPELPEGLDAVVARCLKKDVEDRFATIADLAEALAPFVPEHARHSVARISRKTPAREAQRDEAPASAPPFDDTLAASLPTRRLWPIAAAALALCAAIPAAIVTLRGAPRTPEATPSRVAVTGSAATAPSASSAAPPLVVPAAVGSAAAAPQPSESASAAAPPRAISPGGGGPIKAPRSVGPVDFGGRK
jgi:serine/threonine-protein kinase